jgi:hypothetical protein
MEVSLPRLSVTWPVRDQPDDVKLKSAAIDLWALWFSRYIRNQRLPMKETACLIQLTTVG